MGFGKEAVPRTPYVSETVKIPEGVKVSIEEAPLGYRVIVKGPMGTVSKEFRNVPIIMRLNGDEVVIEGYMLDRKGKAMVYTIASAVNNMIIGVTRGWRYKLKIVYAHFPISVKVQGDTLVIENFLGRKSKIALKIPQGVKVQATKDDVIVEGIDKELVSQFAANIEEATTLRGEERMSPHGREAAPGVLDGIYVYAKENVK